MHYVYILRCADGSYHVGTTLESLEKRISKHRAGIFNGYTALRRPVTLVFHQDFERLEDAISAERQIKEEKKALIRGDYAALPLLARHDSRTGSTPLAVRPSRRGPEGPLLRMRDA